MRIVDLELAVVGGDVAGAADARRRWRRRRGLLLRLRDERGLVGYGEASPLPGYSPETFGQARRALKMWRDGASPLLDLEAPLAEQIRRELAAVDATSPSARCAVETALLDLAGRRLERPSWALLSDAATPAPVPLAALITDLETGAALAAARRATARGIATLKVKIGRPGAWHQELALLDRLRRAVGPDVHLRLDANGSLPPGELADRLAALADCRPQLVEEPVAGDDLLAVAASPVPLAVDESLRRPSGWLIVEHLATRRLCRAVVLKPMVLGGSLACLELARRAAALGVAAVASHLYDGPVALAAAAHL
ncbi:MAG: O-succinylbenzoate synthase, partial [Acidobacteria bacterium]